MRNKLLQAIFSVGLACVAATALSAEEMLEAQGIVGNVDAAVITLGAAPSGQSFVLGATTVMDTEMADNPGLLLGQQVSLKYMTMGSFNYVTDLAVATDE